MSHALRPDRLRRSGAATTPARSPRRPGATLTAIACRTEDTAAAARRDFPDVPVHLDYRELLARGDVDAVDVVVPNDLHAEVGVAALEAGKDVLLEKPMAPTPEECDRLIAAAARTGRVLTIGHELRLSHQWGGIKAMIDAGDIGEPSHAASRPSSASPTVRAPAAGVTRPTAWARGSSRSPSTPSTSLLWYFGRHGGPVTVERRGATAAAAIRRCPTTSPRTLRFPGGRYAVVTLRRWPPSNTT